MGFKEISDKDEIQRVVDMHEITVICFFNPGCGDNRGFMSRFQTLANHYPSIGFYRVDTLGSFHFMKEVGIEESPTTRIFKNGEKVVEVAGIDFGTVETMFCEVIQ